MSLRYAPEKLFTEGDSLSRSVAIRLDFLVYQCCRSGCVGPATVSA
jgi:hypothetical protein